MSKHRIASVDLSERINGLEDVVKLQDVMKVAIEDIDQTCQVRNANRTDEPQPLIQDAVRIAQEAAIDQGIPTALFVPFSSKKAVGIRILAIRTGIALERLVGGDLEPKDWPILTRVAVSILKAPLFIVAGPQFFLDMRNNLQVLKEKNGVQFGVIDLAHMALTAQEEMKMKKDFERVSKTYAVRIVITGGRF